MTITYEDLLAATGGEMCGGDLLARIDDKVVVLGRKRGSVFNLTPAGEEIARTLEDKPANEPKAPKQPKAAKVPKPEGQEIKVDLTSDTTLDDVLG